MLSLCELRRAIPILERRLAGTRVQRFVQLDDMRLVVFFYGPGGNLDILLSCRPDFARICTIERLPEAPACPPSFVQFLRAHLVRARFDGIEPSSHDRRVAVRLAAPDGVFRLILSILGPRSNVYLADPAGKLVHAMRPLETTRSDLRIGEPWTDTAGGPPTEGSDRWRDVSDDNYLVAIAEFYDRSERLQEAATVRRRIEAVLGKEEKFLSRKAANLLEDLGQARQAAEYRHKGELLKSALYAIRTGDESVAVTDHDTGEQVVILIDPKLSPSENLEHYFARYQKESRGIAQIQQQLLEVHDAQQGIESLRESLQSAGKTEEPDLEELKELSSHPRVRRLLARYYPARKAKAPVKHQGRKEIPNKLLPRRYRSEEGLEIWVGRSDEGNDYLTTRLARGNDLFFHLEGYPGSHVVLRTEGREDPPPNSLLDACELAVHFSKMKESSRAEVHVTAAKNVKKPKGAKPGLVYVVRGKTIHLRRDPKRLRSILATRLDE
jgi:predicted ribosome quality control (RQC) complex YloA/Tae2 family protein